MLFKDEKFVGSRVELDGNEFIQCEFDRCRLIFNGLRPVSMIDCNVHDSLFLWGGAAANDRGAWPRVADTGEGPRCSRRASWGALARGPRITKFFYVAVNAVNAYALRTAQLTFGEHRDRDAFVLRQMRHVARNYMSLKQLSRTARYQPAAHPMHPAWEWLGEDARRSMLVRAARA